MKTPFGTNSTAAANNIEDYAAARARVGTEISSRIAAGDEPALVGTAIADAIVAKRPRLRYLVGSGAGLLARLRTFLPAAAFDRGFRKQFHLDS